MKLNCIIVDDSSIQRAVITKLASDHPNLNIINTFSNAVETKACLETVKVDLLFLDIEMPVIDGFNLLDGLTNKPQIIFITAKAEYALKAFDYEPIDYLQKPVLKERFNKAVKRALDLYLLKKDNFGMEEEPEHIFVKSNLKKLKLYTSKIKWVEAFGDYIKIITDSDSHLVLSTMKAFENDLPQDKFFRVHKSFIVNVDKIERLNNKYAEIGQQKIPLSRNKKERLMTILET